MATAAGKTNRFMELEGLRVLAAFLVVFYHAALIFYPAYFYGVGSAMAPVQNMRLEDNLYQNPLAGLLSGTFAVGIFFVLSGFVLSIGFFKKREQSIIVKMASKRYLRLMLPAAASVLFAWLLITLGGARVAHHVAAITHSGWLSQLWTIPPDFFKAVWQGTVAIFTVQEVYYNPVLWTIYHEFIGSLVVFGTGLLFAKSQYRWVAYGMLLFALANTWLFGFALGMILADLYVNKQVVYTYFNKKITYVLILLGVIVAGYPSGVVTSPLYKFLTIPGYTGEQMLSFYTAIGASLLVVGVLSLPELRKLVGHPRLSRFGKYTYALYLVHMPILFTVCTGIFILALPLGFNKAALVSIIWVWAVILPVTYLFEKYVDAPSIRFASYSAEVYLGERQLATEKITNVLKKIQSVIKPKRKHIATPEMEVEMEVE